jgi:heme/copper-type cytochrome/quinol oxidase subunit 3
VVPKAKVMQPSPSRPTTDRHPERFIMRPPFPADAWPLFGGGLSPEDSELRYARAAQIGVFVMLISLVMLFGGSLVAYLFYRFGGKTSPAMGAMVIPQALWISTVLLVTSAFTMHRARSFSFAQKVPLKRQAFWLLGTFVLAIVFLVVQTPSLMTLLADHEQANSANRNGLYGAVFTLIIVHALHVIGGLLTLGFLLWRARQHRLGRHQVMIRGTTAYWHFLDGVWVTMFVVFLLTA